jgi:(p)ppGpp synthase/HD superfamily hydrolase
MDGLVKVLKAAEAAARWHSGQTRKGAAREPYVNHLLEVASLVAEATGGRDPDLLAAALLHDAVEDQEISRDRIAVEFGEEVAVLVAEVTDDKSLPKAERKRLQVEHAPAKSHRAALIKLADKTSNLRAVARSPAEGWSQERRLGYVNWAREVVAGLPAVNVWLESEFAAAAEAAERAARAEA